MHRRDGATQRWGSSPSKTLVFFSSTGWMATARQAADWHVDVLVAHAPVVRPFVCAGRRNHWGFVRRVSAAMGWHIRERPQKGPKQEQTKKTTAAAKQQQGKNKNNKKVMSMPTFHGLLVCSKVRYFLGVPIPSCKYPAFNAQPTRVVYYSKSGIRKQTSKQVPPREHRQTQQNTKQSKLATVGKHADLSATAIWATSSTMSTSSGTTILVTPPLSLSTSRVVCWL